MAGHRDRHARARRAPGAAARRRPRVPGPGGRRDPADGRPAGRRHVDVHRGRAAVDGPAVARPGAAGARLRRGWLGAARGPACRAGGARPRLLDRRVDGARRRPADGGDPRAAGLRPRRPGARAAAAAVRDRDLRRAPVAGRDAHRASALAVGGAAAGRAVGEHPRVVRARAAGPRVRVARRRRPEAPAAPVAVRPRRRPARDVRDAVRPRRLGLRGGDRRQPGDHRPGQRVAADDAAHGAGGAVLRLGDRDAAGDVARPAGAALARLAVDRRDARDRRVDGPRPRVVAVRGGVRGRGGAPARPGLAPARGHRRRGATREPGRRDLRVRVRPRDRRRAALVAARGPADRPRRPALLRPVGAGAGGRDPGAAGRQGVRPADVGVVVRVGRTGARLLPRLPLRAVPGRGLGRLRADRAGRTRGAGRPRPMGRDRPRAARRGPSRPRGGCRPTRTAMASCCSAGAGKASSRWYLRTTRRARWPLLWSPDRGDRIDDTGPHGHRHATSGPGAARHRRARRRRARRPAAQPRVRRRRPARRHLRHQRGDARAASGGARCRSWSTAPTSCSATSWRPAASSSAPTPRSSPAPTPCSS